MTHRDDQIRTLIERYHGDLPELGQFALFELIHAAGPAGSDPSLAQLEALDAYLDAMGAPQLKTGPARDIAVESLRSPSTIVARMFFSSSTKSLSPADRDAVQRVVIDRLFSETWPLPTEETTPQAAAKAPRPPDKSFDISDFDALMVPLFNRDRSYAIQRQELEHLLTQSLGTLNNAMADADLSPVDQKRYLKLFEDRYGRTIRDHLDQLAKGAAPGGYFHFMS